ncbi:hypothetical protein [Streptomyces sp. NPDC018972]|uniref:hypothetical protein n=1 Tax=Streptomyces sp. NPDC018972 TaxID=3365060 RepID=UPI0037A5DD43
MVTERQAELLLREGRNPGADRIERELLAQGKSPAQARRAAVLGRPTEHNRLPMTDKAKECIPWLAFDLTFRPPLTGRPLLRPVQAVGVGNHARPGHELLLGSTAKPELRSGHRACVQRI